MKKVREMFSNARLMFDDFEKMFDDLDDEVDTAESPSIGETVTTKREETRLDGTRIVTTITKTKIAKVTTITSDNVVSKPKQ